MSFLQAWPVTSQSSKSEDLVFFNDITVPEKAAADFPTQFAAVLEKLEALLGGAGMSKHDLIDVKTTICDMSGPCFPHLGTFNSLWNDWATGIEVLPSMTAAQVVAFDGGVLLGLSVTASKASKKALPHGLTRTGGKAVSQKLTYLQAADVSVEPVSMVFPWSPVVQVGNITWLAGTLDSSGGCAEKQTKQTLTRIEDMLEKVGLTKAEVLHTHALVPNSLSEAECEAIKTVCQACGGSFEITRVVRTCADAKVELTCICIASQPR